MVLHVTFLNLRLGLDLNHSQVLLLPHYFTLDLTHEMILSPLQYSSIFQHMIINSYEWFYPILVLIFELKLKYEE
jgi:hypothetical protein